MAKTMKAAVVHEFGKPLKIEEVPIPTPGRGEVLVKIVASGVCHTDLHAAAGDWPIKPKPPFIPGHEGAGIILDAFHFFRGGNRLDILPHINPTSIVAVHLDNAMDLPLHELVGYRHRVYTGDGVFDVEGFCRALFHIGYRGPYVEIGRASCRERV